MIQGCFRCFDILSLTIPASAAFLRPFFASQHSVPQPKASRPNTIVAPHEVAHNTLIDSRDLAPVTLPTLGYSFHPLDPDAWPT